MKKLNGVLVSCGVSATYRLTVNSEQLADVVSHDVMGWLGVKIARALVACGVFGKCDYAIKLEGDGLPGGEWRAFPGGDLVSDRLRKIADREVARFKMERPSDFYKIAGERRMMLDKWSN